VSVKAYSHRVDGKPIGLMSLRVQTQSGGAATTRVVHLSAQEAAKIVVALSKLLKRDYGWRAQK